MQQAARAHDERLRDTIRHVLHGTAELAASRPDDLGLIIDTTVALLGDATRARG